ncbi:MAG: STAS domain-containing protein [Acidimicrobiales bacterium]|jgi:anti-sigma B factor antagonist
MIVETDFSISERIEDGTAVLCIGGEADVVTAPQIRDALLSIADCGEPVIVDLSSLSFIDSTALGVLVVARRRFTEGDGELRLAGLQPHVRKVFDITGLSDVFPIHVDTVQAKRALLHAEAS